MTVNDRQNIDFLKFEPARFDFDRNDIGDVLMFVR